MDGGKDTLDYDKLVLAPGGTPRRLPLEGADLENVYTLRGIADSQKIDDGILFIFIFELEACPEFIL